MYQQITLVGNAGADAEMRYTPSGVPVASFSIAVNKVWNDQASGEQKTKTLWVRVSAWRKLGEIAAQYITKGKLLLVIGEVEQVRAYTAKDGTLAAALEVTAQTIKFLSKSEGSGDHQPNGIVQATGAQRLPESLAELEDIPF